MTAHTSDKGSRNYEVLLGISLGAEVSPSGYEDLIAGNFVEISDKGALALTPYGETWLNAESKNQDFRSRMDEKPRPVRDRGPNFYRKPDGGFVRPRFHEEGLHKLAAAIPVIGNVSEQSYGMALVILELMFGIKWLERHVLDEPKNGFLGRSLTIEGGHNIVVHRVRSLAEMIINLQDEIGVEAPIEILAGGDIEAGYAELEAGKLLLTRNIDFRFIWPSGERGTSFDLEVMFPNGVAVCADTKCKIETEAFSPSGVLNTLNKARRRNLPKGFPGMVILKIPQEWHDSFFHMIEIRAACDDFLRQSKRIVCVEIYSSMVEVRDGIVHDWLKGTEIRNNFHQHNPSLNWRLLTYSRNAVPTNPERWWSLVNFIKETK